MFLKSIIKKTLLGISLTSIAVSIPLLSYAAAPSDSDVSNLIAGFGSNQIKLMAKAPLGNAVTIPTNEAQATYLLSPNSPLVGPLTQKLLGHLATLGEDSENDKLSLLWSPDKKIDPEVEKDPIKSVDINSLLQPMTYNDTESTEALNVIDALNNSLLPLTAVNFNDLVANLSGDKNANIKAKLGEKKTQTYLANLRSYLAAQSAVLGNFYQFYAERKPIDASKLSPELKKAFDAVSAQIKGPVSALQLENYMATRRILDKNWYDNLVNENPATLQREQVQILAELLAETHQSRMTNERLLATMSVLVLELGSSMRPQLQNQINTLTNPPKTQA